MDASARSPGRPQRESDHAGRHDRAIPRAGIAAAAFCMQLALGAVYGWSVFLNPLREQFGASRPEANLTFTITLAVLGITAGFGGGLQRRIGPRATATIAGVLYGCGVILSGFAPNLGTLYVSYGVLGGIGLGLGYIVPLAVLIEWFPDRRGFITGLAVTGFGLGALITSPLATELIKAHGVQSTLMMLGAAYLLIVVAAAQFLRPAPADYAPPGWTPVAQQALTFRGTSRRCARRCARRTGTCCGRCWRSTSPPAPP